MALLIGTVTNKILKSDVTSASWTHDNNGNAVYVLITSNADASITVTYDDDAMTLVDTQVSGLRQAWIYRILNPDAGESTVSVSGLTTGYFIGYSISFINCDVSGTPNGAAAKATATSTTPSVNVDSGLGEIVIDICAVKGSAAGVTGSAGANQTERLNSGASGAGYLNAFGSSERYSATGSSPVTMSWDISTSLEWAIVGVSIKPIPSSVKTVNGVTMAYTKTISGISVASIKSVQGIS
jgi:hypothetical protein